MNIRPDIPPDILAALRKVAQEMDQPQALQTTLDTIVETAALSLPGIDHVGITIAGRDGQMETKAGTDPLVWELDELQYRLGEGPCVHAIGVEPVITVEWARSDERWPRFMALAVGKGLRSQIGMRLYTERETLGGLNMYSTSSDTIDPDVTHMAELFAAHASLALGHARREEQLSTALSTRKVIGQAIGILMERYDLDEDGAFAYLTRVSSRTNVKLRLVAQQIVELRSEFSDRLDDLCAREDRGMASVSRSFGPRGQGKPRSPRT